LSFERACTKFDIARAPKSSKNKIKNPVSDAGI
jgi:hypothetical protein